MTTDKHPCGHSTCDCLIEGTAAFCSSYCAEAASAPADVTGATCECGHPSCAGKNIRSTSAYISIDGEEKSTRGKDSPKRHSDEKRDGSH